KMAATFVNLATGKAVRVVALESARDKALHYCQTGAVGHEAQIQAYQIMPEEEILTLTPVFVNIPPQDMPGPPSRRATCEACGECVNDGRELLRDGRVLCRSCAGGSYYTQVLS
ncbi:MAG: TraR/DksA C4-type zinc finger protein, partial [Dehalococcoidia bacterium]|nr:TraR/DksA C4-type zinc finger protein [Dehalococcoidia bacterium]